MCSSLSRLLVPFKPIRGLQQHLMARAACAALSKPTTTGNAAVRPVDKQVDVRRCHQYTANLEGFTQESPLSPLWQVEDVALPSTSIEKEVSPLIGHQTFSRMYPRRLLTGA